MKTIGRLLLGLGAWVVLSGMKREKGFDTTFVQFPSHSSARVLLSPPGKPAQICDMITRKVLFTLPRRDNSSDRIQVSPLGTYVADIQATETREGWGNYRGVFRGDLRVYEVISGKKIVQMTIDQAEVAFSPDERWLVVSLPDHGPAHEMKILAMPANRDALTLQWERRPYEYQHGNPKPSFFQDAPEWQLFEKTKKAVFSNDGQYLMLTCDEKFVQSDWRKARYKFFQVPSAGGDWRELPYQVSDSPEEIPLIAIHPERLAWSKNTEKKSAPLFVGDLFGVDSRQHTDVWQLWGAIVWNRRWVYFPGSESGLTRLYDREERRWVLEIPLENLPGNARAESVGIALGEKAVYLLKESGDLYRFGHDKSVKKMNSFGKIHRTHYIGWSPLGYSSGPQWQTDVRDYVFSPDGHYLLIQKKRFTLGDGMSCYRLD